MLVNVILLFFLSTALQFVGKIKIQSFQLSFLIFLHGTIPQQQLAKVALYHNAKTLQYSAEKTNSQATP